MSNIELRLGIFMLAVALGILVFLGAQSSPKQTPPKPHPTGYHGLPDYTQDAEGTEAEMKKLALRTRGDYSKLSFDEKTWIEGVTANHGDLTLRLMAKRYLAEEQKKKVGKKPVSARPQNAKPHGKAAHAQPQKQSPHSGAKHPLSDPSKPALPSGGK
ncbi:MAG TPA: hypothetical protein VFA07_17165 [Chthonomonadaceae bacterium]|nr:hypothetical protein [Chthonomonadaceae bacterium]